ncbi:MULTISPECIES: carbohydrate ABC transporter permease [unclassified Oceanispirochaeta]|uniref:carbohydrate ABC transporter permease n=1 Tax=unclassified Oceanispirochaeta TaxID=2635722 RepID=UPI000E08F864|nr:MULTISPECIES: sugar ABC transporter permease [unclassified Oceanispirochaeta]MBF9015861.1 sugar ABC transporter permease [Oceanispirochaeta sp. M2]NPD72324.1 sugar ABC transporter permease [Oceanispirochaeta sp. M1]RDG32094.1 sugar ABC transporter permease [Oceanispirochaeta sp. M1]
MTRLLPVSRLGQKDREELLGWGLVFPAVFIILALILYPIIFNIYLSFFDVNLHEGNTFTGLENHRSVLTDPFFWKSVWTTVVYVFFTTVGTTVFGLIVALAMNQSFPLRGLVRSLVLFPYVAPVISVVFAWQFIFDPVNGIVMDVLVERLGLLGERVNLIGSPSSAVWVAIMFSIWKNFPFSYLMILSRLQGIDNNLYEAAEVDGASGWEKFRYITFPEIYFVTSSIVLLRVIWNFNKFEEIYLLTTNVKVLSIYTYFKAFVGTMDMGQGAALALIQFLLLIGFILIYVKKVLKW